MRKLGVVIGLVACLSTAEASARAVPPHWVSVGEHVDGATVEVDAAHIVRTGVLVRGWWRIALMAPREDGTAREENLDAVDCARRLSTAIAQTRYDAGGQVLARTRESEDAAMRRLSPATPGTTGEIADRAICRLYHDPRRR